MSSSDYPAGGSARNTPAARRTPGGAKQPASPPARVGTIVWGLIVLALALLIIVSRLGLVALNGTYVLIGLMIGAGAALVIGGLLSARGRDKDSSTGKS
jgi:membrane-associated phospholipid phosphatase